jgi:hypothetical protein
MLRSSIVRVERKVRHRREGESVESRKTPPMYFCSWHVVNGFAEHSFPEILPDAQRACENLSREAVWIDVEAHSLSRNICLVWPMFSLFQTAIFFPNTQNLRCWSLL